MKADGKWYPKSVLTGSAATTEQVAKRVAAELAVSPADVRVVLTTLGLCPGRDKNERQTSHEMMSAVFVFPAAFMMPAAFSCCIIALGKTSRS